MSSTARLALAAALAVGCAEPASFAAGSSTIVRAGDGTLWLTSPDDDAVVAIDPVSLEEVTRVAVEGGPEQLAFVDGRLVVTLGLATEIAIVDGDDVTRVPVPCGGTRAVVADGRGGALISCPHDDLVLGVVDGAVAWTMPSPGRPTALAVNGDRFAVSASRLGRLRVHALADRRLLREDELVREPGFAAIQVDASAPFEGDFVATYQRVDRDSDRARPASAGGYGSVVDGEPRIEPRVHGACGARYARFDGGARVFSGPSAIAWSGEALFVAHLTTHDVAVLGCGGDDLLPRRATHRVGRGPRGIVVDGDVAWVDVGFGHAVARLEPAADGAVVEPALERTRALGPTRLSDAALRGRASFYDADDTHLTPSGIVTCGTCHPAGGEDGLTWFFHTAAVGPKLRRTPPAWAARAALAPFHWDGEFTDGGALSRATIRELMEGDGLLVDTDAMAAWMAEAPIPPGRPPVDAAQAARGQGLFEARCAACHAGELFADGMSHAVLEPAEDPVAHLETAYTPTLRAVRARPPYLHDGRAPTLRAVLTDHNPGDRHGQTSDLAAPDLDALVAYLETL